jgi:hypothetical protein
LNETRAAKRRQLEANSDVELESNSNIGIPGTQIHEELDNDAGGATDGRWYFCCSLDESSLSSSGDESDEVLEDEVEVNGRLRDQIQFTSHQSEVFDPSPQTLRLSEAGEAKLCDVWGNGSSATRERKRRHERKLQRQASQSLNIKAMFESMRTKAANNE